MNESTLPVAKESFPSIDDATAAALAAIVGDSSASAKKSAFEELALRNEALISGGDGAIVDALARQATLLEAVVTSLFTSAGKSNDANITRMALTGAFSAQRVLVQVLGAMHQVRHSG